MQLKAINATKHHRVGLALDPDSRDRTCEYDPEVTSILVLEAMRQGGLGQLDADAPLRDIIQPGMTVLLKPNWVLHENMSGQGMDCLVTHPVFILAVLRQVFACQPGRVVIGDAPIQLCHFESLVTREWIREVEAMATCPVEIADFRRTVARSTSPADGFETNVRDVSRYVLFDLGRESLLEPISRPSGRFRITNYDPRDLAKTHRAGRHQYLLCREAFEADVILNLPKLKTHKKAGITAALKNLVGMNGSKEFLPHHRIGGSQLGGDCYPGIAPLKRAMEFCLDRANRNIGTEKYRTWQRRASRFRRWQRRFGDTEIEGSWHGNDTVWRMSLDLNRLLVYGAADGGISDARARTIYSITDGIIAGDGDGPLSPSPVPLGAVTFAASSAHAEVAHAGLMQFDWRRVPIVSDAFGDFRYPLSDVRPEDTEVFLQGRRIPLDELPSLGLPFQPASGWEGHIELPNRRHASATR